MIGTVVERFPADPAGWKQAWASLVRKVGEPRPVLAAEGRVISEEVKLKVVASLSQQGKYRRALQTGDLAMISVM
jgi:hypothetical protein